MRHVACAVTLLTGFVAAQEFTYLSPHGGTPGSEVEVRVYGRGLEDIVSVGLFGTGIDVVAVEPDRTDRARVKLAIRPDCPLGVHLMLLHTKRGITRVKAFHVGPLPAVPSRADNITAGAAQGIELDTTIDGRLLAEETDWFAFDARKDQVVRIEVEGIRLGDTDWDPELEITGPDGVVVCRGDDSALGKLDPITAFRVPADGTYRLALRDVAARGSRTTGFRLHVGTFARPLGLVPAGGRPGATEQVRLVGGLEDGVATVTWPDRVGLAEVFPVVDGRPIPTPVLVAVDERPSFVEGATPEAAPTAPCAFHGVVGVDGEEDRFAFAAKKGERIDLRVLARTLGSPLDPVLYVRKADGGVLAGNDDTLGLDSRLRFTAPDDGTFLACVRDQLGTGAADRFYRLEVGVLDDGATTSEQVPGRRPEDFGIAVPRGGRAATIVQLAGLDPQLGATLGFAPLPAGVTAQVAGVRADLTAVPVVFDATADAALAFGLAEPVVTTTTEPHERLVRHLHGVPLLRVSNDQTYLQRAMRALPVAVTDPCPFAVELDAPKLPIAQTGSMALPFRLVRADGFDDAVTVRMLWTPPGLSAGTATLGKGQTSGTIALSARSNATVGTWPIVLVATASIGGVARTVSSTLVELDVQEPWLTAKLARARVELGATGSMQLAITRPHAFEGEVIAEFGRLPKGVVATIPPITADTAKVAVEFTAAADAQVGRHRSIYLRLVARTPDGDVVQAFGGGEIRVDRPLPANGNGGER